MNGILLLDKPAGITSAEVVRKVKALVKPTRVGHLGTLDPFATGLLPILIGEATKLAQFLEHSSKHYQGAIALGRETDTLDATGAVTKTAEVAALEPELVAEVARRFTGRITQVPPIFSAIKRGGMPLYKLARRGEEVEPPAAREVTIEELWLEPADPLRLRFGLRCSTGTYVRSLARDIGEALGTVAHLEELTRLETAGFSLNDALALDVALEALNSADQSRLIGLTQALPAMEQVSVDRAIAERLRNGDAAALLGSVRMGRGPVKVVSQQGLVAIAQMTPGEGLSLLRVFVA